MKLSIPFMGKKYIAISIILTATIPGAIVVSCTKDNMASPDNNIEFFPRLSMYNVFNGNTVNLIPNNNYHQYVLNTALFTDYAEKQRLVMTPSGSAMRVNGDGSVDFPDGTILVKTFFYYNDKRDTTKGKRLVETRLLIKRNVQWNVATYLWNDEQTDALLLPAGINKTVNWIDGNGNARVISYHVPSKNECATCHSKAGSIIPIGSKAENMNREIVTAAGSKNQLRYFSEIGIMNAINPATISVLPNWEDNGYNIEERARAYMDVNCAHCHNESGVASAIGLNLAYEIPLDATGITKRKKTIIERMESGDMPRLGTTIIDEEGLQVVSSYMESLK